MESINSAAIDTEKAPLLADSNNGKIAGHVLSSSVREYGYPIQAYLKASASFEGRTDLISGLSGRPSNREIQSAPNWT